jgi:MFS family permease
VTHLVRSVPAADVDLALRPRHDVVVEREVGPGRFEAATGPFTTYRREVEVGPDGRATEVVDYQLALAVWFPLSTLVRRSLARGTRRGLWWAPPQAFDATQATALGLLAVLALLSGYLGTLLTQTITFASDEFGAGPGSQGATLAAVRVGVLGSLVVTTIADRRGRRRFLLGALVAASVVTATGALAPGLIALGTSQTVARGLVTAAAVLVAIVAAEEMPAGARAYGVSMLSMAGALGAGVCVWILPLADLDVRAWRLLYVVPLAFLPLLAWVARRLPESRRFRVVHTTAPLAGHGRRFWLLAASAVLLNVFAAPASQFMNEFLRDERGFSAARITLFTLSTNTPGVIGIIVGGRLADLRGRRIVGAVAVAGGTVATALMFAVGGASMWLLSVAGAIVGAATVPALGVYGPELFPTSLRGRANGVIAVLGVSGSAAGLVAAGLLADRYGQFGPAFAILAVGPLLMALLVITAYPETAKQTLEQINPEDQPLPEPLPEPLPGHTPRPGAPVGGGPGTGGRSRGPVEGDDEVTSGGDPPPVR